MRGLLRMGWTGAGVLLVLTIFAVPAGAQEYPPAGDTIAVSDATPSAGQQITVSGTGCDPNVSVTVFYDDRRIGSTAADASGSFSTEVTIPEDAQPGQHTIRAVGAGCDVATTITVLATVRPVEQRLATTGSDFGPLVWIALALVAVGTTIVVGIRRRASVRKL